MTYTDQELNDALQAVLNNGSQGNTTDSQDGSAGLYKSGKLFVNQFIFIVDTLQDAQSIEAAGGAAIALGTAQGPFDLVNLLTDWNGPDWQDGAGAVIVSKTTDAASAWRSTDIINEVREIHIKCMEWNLCGKCKTPQEAAAADPALFAQKVREALTAAETARIPDDLDAFLEKIQTRRYEPHATGLQFFDDLLAGGVIDGTTLIMTAPPAAGKTSLCLQLAGAIATNKTPVVYLNFEMSNDQMLAKAISCQLAAGGKHYSTTKILQGYTWNNDARETITAAVDKYRETTAPFLSFKPQAVSNDLDAVLSYLQELGDAAERSGKRAPAVILDYLHIITTKQRIDVKELIKQVVYGVKNYAARYNTFAVLISASSREASKNSTPTMADARDSSNIEFSGDYVMSLQAVDDADKEPQRLGDKNAPKPKEWRQMKLYLLKNRFGRSDLYTEVYFNTAANYFLPVAGFTPDGAEPFTTDPEKPIKII